MDETPHQKTGKAQRKRTPTGLRTNPVTKERWGVYLQWVSNGATRQEAAVAASMSVQTVKAHCQVEPQAMLDIRKAEREWYRRDWPIERIDEFLVWVALGCTNKDAAKQCDFMDGELQQLMTIILHDSAIRQMYDEARKIQAETWADEMIEIADLSDGDTYVDARGDTKTNHDVINRSKLKIDTRQWIIARLHHERWGDKQTQKHEGELTVNHSDVLDNARKRKEQAKQKTTELMTSALTESPGESRVH